MNWKSIFNRIKIPKRFKELDGEKIEIRNAKTQIDRIVGDPFQKYEIRLSHGISYNDLGYVLSAKKGKGQYEVVRYFRIPGQRTISVGTFKEIGDANSTSYRTAHEIAQKLAKINKLPLEDMVFEDEQKLEDDELAMKIDSLRSPKLLIFIFLIFGGIALSISSLTQTGNAILDINGTTKGLFGILMLIMGMIGVFFYLKLNKLY